jgi:uncharacterized protein (TIGR03067 family)
MLARTFCLLGAATLFAAARPVEKKAPTDLQGTWRLVSVEIESGPVALPDRRPALVIAGDRVLHGGDEIARIATDAAADPKVLDLRFGKPERVYEGVYAIAKDTLKVCLNGRSAGLKERPTSFAVKDQPNWRLLVFERVKTGSAEAGSGFVGLALGLDAARQELIVAQVLDGSPARKAGLHKGDALLDVGGVRVANLREAVEAVRRAEPRSQLALRVRRDGKEREVTVRVGLLPFTVVAGLD